MQPTEAEAEPLVFTSKGNLPAKSLRLETAWQDAADFVAFRERYYLGDEVVKESVHVLKRQGESVTPLQAAL